MATEAKTLEDVKKSLYKSFSKAADKLDAYTYDFDGFMKVQRFMNEVAEKIVSVEQQIAMNDLLKKAGEAGRDIEVDLDKRTIKSVTAPAAPKVKTLGQ